MIEVLNRDFVNNNCDLKLFALHAHIFLKNYTVRPVRLHRREEMGPCSSSFCFVRLFACFCLFFKLIKIHQHCWKEHIKISKAAKFGNDILKSNQDMAPQLNGILLGQVYDPILNYLCSSQT